MKLLILVLISTQLVACSTIASRVVASNNPFSQAITFAYCAVNMEACDAPYQHDYQYDMSQCHRMEDGQANDPDYCLYQ